MYLKFVCLLVFLFYGLRLDTLHTISPELQSKRVEASRKSKPLCRFELTDFTENYTPIFLFQTMITFSWRISNMFWAGVHVIVCVCFYAGTFAGPGHDTVTTNRWQQVLVLISSSLNEWFMIHSKWLIQLVTKQIAVFINGLLDHWFKWFIHKQIHSVMKHCNVALRDTNILLRLGLELKLFFFFFLQISLAKQKKKTYNDVLQM